jgi:hypothetical protein
MNRIPMQYNGYLCQVISSNSSTAEETEIEGMIPSASKALPIIAGTINHLIFVFLTKAYRAKTRLHHGCPHSA